MHILSEVMLERCYILTFSVKSCWNVVTFSPCQSVKVVTISHLEKEVLNDPTLTATLLWVWRIHQLPDQVFSSKIELLNSLYENKNPPDASLVYLFENFKLSDFLPDNLCVSPFKRSCFQLILAKNSGNYCLPINIKISTGSIINHQITRFDFRFLQLGL